MSNEDLIEKILAFNRSELKIDESKRLSEHIIYVKELDAIGERIYYNQYYFIKFNSQVVGVVLDMGNDLHWIILPIFRKKGYLTTALKWLMPYLRKKKKKRIRITIEKDNLDSIRIAKKIGFKKKRAIEQNYGFIQRDFFTYNYY